MKQITAVVAMLCAFANAQCGPPRSPREPQPCGTEPSRPWEKPNPVCPGISTITAFCCGCPQAETLFERRIQALELTVLVRQQVEACRSTPDIEECIKTSVNLDKEIRNLILSIAREASKTEETLEWQQCNSRSLRNGTCQRIDKLMEETEERRKACHPRDLQLSCCQPNGTPVCPNYSLRPPGSPCGCPGLWGSGFVCAR